jgi:hypothetical protein
MTMKYHHSYSGLLAISCSILSRITLTNSFVPSTSSSSIVAVATQYPFSSLARRTKTDFRLQMSSSATSSAMDTIQGAQSMIDAIIDEKNCNPVLVRLAWHDSGTYDVNLQDQPWPQAGGAIGSIRFQPEITHGANKGLANAIALLEPVKAAYPDMSYSDIFQMASARAIELAGGPKIDMRYECFW